MPSQILSTKLSIPPPRPRSVSRPQLIQKLNQGLDCGFILISAPAGYGKSTLLSSWLHRLECGATWLSLDESDNDSIRFFSYLIAAIAVIDPSIEGSLDVNLRYSSQFSAENLLTPFINYLDKVKHPFYIILDDYHVIQNQSIHQAIGFLLEHRPSSLHLVISTRADPPLPLARMRARSEMIELRMADLRFTKVEAVDFLTRTMGLKVSPDDIDCLVERTEGWIAGLQMAALSMQNTDDIASFISALSGSHHYIFDYLLEEILTRESAENRRFLLCTSILDQLSAPLCDALLADGDESLPRKPSVTILDELEHANLFIIPLDHEQRWYRYHALFADLLRNYLKQRDPAKVPLLHNRASAWFESQGMIPEAIRHSFAAHDWEHIVRLISANIFALLEQNELTSVARQLESLTSENNPARPWLLVGRAWLAAYTGQLSAVEPILKSAEGEIDSLKSESDLEKLGGHIAAIRAYTNWIGDRRDIAASAAQAALEWLPESETLLRCQAATLLGLVLNDYPSRNQAFKQALAYSQKCSVSHVTIFAHGCWAWMLSMQGRLRESQSACLEAIQLAGSSSTIQSLPTLSHVYSTLSFVLCEWNDLDGALRYSKEAVALARHWEQADALHFALDNLGYAQFASGDADAAFDTLHQAWQVARRTSRWFEEISLSQEIEWHLALSNLDAAMQCLKRADIDIEQTCEVSESAYKCMLLPLAMAQILIAQKQYTRALELLEFTAGNYEKNGVIHYLIRSLVWQSLAYQGLREDTKALETLNRVLLLAQPEGYLRTFIKVGPRIKPLLHQARQAGITPEYTDSLLAAFETAGESRPGIKGNISNLVEPLSRREMDVLRLLAQGCSDKKIAESLVIARETVHKHLKNIYGKLDVHSRSEAIARGRELGLL